MTNAEAIRAWDSEVIATYIAMQNHVWTSEARVRLTLRLSCARQLDTTLRSLAPSLAFDHHCACAGSEPPGKLRAAGVEVAIASYLRASERFSPATAGIHPTNATQEAMLYRLAPSLRARLLCLEVRIAARTLSSLDAYLQRAIETRTTPLDRAAWEGDLLADLRSAVVESLLTRWIEERQRTLGSPVASARARRANGRATRIRQRRRP